MWLHSFKMIQWTVRHSSVWGPQCWRYYLQWQSSFVQHCMYICVCTFHECDWNAGTCLCGKLLALVLKCGTKKCISGWDAACRAREPKKIEMDPKLNVFKLLIVVHMKLQLKSDKLVTAALTDSKYLLYQNVSFCRFWDVLLPFLYRKCSVWCSFFWRVSL